MERTYTDFMDEITTDELYEGLLAYGLFAEKLPPIFTAVPFYNYCVTSKKLVDKKWKEFITFRVMRNIGIPRIMGIPNPFKYQTLCFELKENWKNIQTHFHDQTDGQEYKISRIHIRKKQDQKCIFEMNYKNWRVDGNPELDLLIHYKGTSRFLVKADISTFFPSIYTHSIPWALVGKDLAKEKTKEETWYNKIDKACSAMRNGETHGLLIGPHASNLVSEIILTVVDKKLYDKGYRFIRNIDDYDCYVCSNDEANRFLRDLEQALLEFDLPMNHKKTKIINLPVGMEDNWKHQLSDLPKIGTYGMVEYPQINMYIDTALKLATETGDFAIVNYAIKKLKSSKVSENGKKLAAKRFMHLTILYPYLLHLMEEFVFIPYDVSKKDIKSFSNTIYKNAIKINDYESLCYSIYFAIRFNFVLDEFENNFIEAEEYVITSNDCLLLTMTWIYLAKQNQWNRKAKQLKKLNDMAEKMEIINMDRYWLFCYEALTAKNLDGEWKKIKEVGVSFIRKEVIDGGHNAEIDIN